MNFELFIPRLVDTTYYFSKLGVDLDQPMALRVSAEVNHIGCDVLKKIFTSEL